MAPRHLEGGTRKTGKRRAAHRPEFFQLCLRQIDRARVPMTVLIGLNHRHRAYSQPEDCKRKNGGGNHDFDQGKTSIVDRLHLADQVYEQIAS